MRRMFTGHSVKAHVRRAQAGLLLVAVFVLACNSDKPGGSRRKDAAQGSPAGPRGAPVRVVVERPVEADGNQELVLPGTVEAWERAALFARVTGYLDSVAVEIGDEVKSGAEIARIVVPEIGAELRSAEATVAQEQAELELARLTRTRLENLRKTNSEAIPQQDVDVAAAKEHIEAAQVGVAQAQRDRLRTLLGYARIKAPFAGRVTQRFLHPGALVREGTASGTQPVVEIVRTDRLRLSFSLPESVAPRVREGVEVKLRFDAFPGEEVDGVVSRVSGALDESTRSMRAEIDLHSGANRYEPGMYASVRLSALALEGALRIPSRAVRGQGNERYCLVAREGVLHRVPVVVASDDGRSALIVQGLTIEDRVMVSGSTLAREGAKCEVVEETGK